MVDDTMELEERGDLYRSHGAAAEIAFFKAGAPLAIQQFQHDPDWADALKAADGIFD